MYDKEYFKTFEKNKARMVRSMDFVVNQVNHLPYCDEWYLLIPEGTITTDTKLKEITAMGYTEDSKFEELMLCFLRCMGKANKKGGLSFMGEITVGNDEK